MKSVSSALQPNWTSGLRPAREDSMQEYARFCDVPALENRLLHDVLLAPVARAEAQLNAVLSKRLKPQAVMADVTAHLFQGARFACSAAVLTASQKRRISTTRGT